MESLTTIFLKRKKLYKLVIIWKFVQASFWNVLATFVIIILLVSLWSRMKRHKVLPTEDDGIDDINTSIVM